MVDVLHVVTRQGRTAQAVEGFLGKDIEESKVLHALTDVTHPEIGILPPVVRWMSPSRKYILFERPPTIQTISFHAGKPLDIADGQVKEHVFEIPMPWTLYAVELGDDYYPTDVSCYALSHSVENGKDPIGILPLPNHYRSGAVCMPKRDFAEQASTVADGINIAYRSAWMSGFNHDMNYNIKHCSYAMRPYKLFKGMKGRATALKIYRAWQKLSLEEVSSWDDWPMPNGYGHGPNAYKGKVASIDYLTAVLNSWDSQRTTQDPTNNLAIAIKQAISAAHLRY